MAASRGDDADDDSEDDDIIWLMPSFALVLVVATQPQAI